LKSCYDQKSASNFTRNDVVKLGECKKDCKLLEKDIKTFIENVEFLAQVIFL